jgi:hypothetical protein
MSSIILLTLIPLTFILKGSLVVLMIQSSEEEDEEIDEYINTAENVPETHIGLKIKMCLRLILLQLKIWNPISKFVMDLT